MEKMLQANKAKTRAKTMEQDLELQLLLFLSGTKNYRATFLSTRIGRNVVSFGAAKTSGAELPAVGSTGQRCSFSPGPWQNLEPSEGLTRGVFIHTDAGTSTG